MTEDLCGHSFSAAAVPSVVKRIDAPAAFSDRRLEEPFLYLIPGARYEKSRENGIVRPRALRPDDENCADSFTSIRDRRLVMLALYRRVSLDMNVYGQTVLVTGGASGLGEATARALASAGARVGILDTNAKQARSVTAEIGGAAAVCDVVDPVSHEAAMAAMRAQLGPARTWSPAPASPPAPDW